MNKLYLVTLMSLAFCLTLWASSSDNELEDEIDLSAGLSGPLTLFQRTGKKDSASESDSDDEVDFSNKLVTPFYPSQRTKKKAFTSNVLNARHSDDIVNRIDGVNMNRGEGLPYREEESLEHLVKRLPDSKKLNISHGAYQSVHIPMILSLRDLETLDISDNFLTEEDICHLCSLPNLKTLRARFLNIGTMNRALNDLAQHPTLTALDLSHNKITDAGALVFVQNKTLKTLDLSDNKVSSEGVVALSQNPTLTVFFNKD